MFGWRMLLSTDPSCVCLRGNYENCLWYQLCDIKLKLWKCSAVKPQVIKIWVQDQARGLKEMDAVQCGWLFSPQCSGNQAMPRQWVHCYSWFPARAAHVWLVPCEITLERAWHNALWCQVCYLAISGSLSSYRNSHGHTTKRGVLFDNVASLDQTIITREWFIE